jgi:bile acid:Na+ symporter, BASS family
VSPFELLLALIYFFIVSSMFSIGLNLGIKEILDPFKKPGVLVNSIALNLLAIPLAGVGLAILFGLEGAAFLGFLIMACSPGASYGPRITEFAGGDVGHSIGLMFLLCMVAIISAPLTVILLIPGTGNIDIWPVIRTLAIIQVIPLFFGMFIKAKRPQLTERISAPVFWLSNISAAIVVVLAFAIRIFGDSKTSIFETICPCAILATILLVIISLVAGYYLGGAHEETRKSMAVSTSIRNAGVAFLIAVGSFAEVSGVLSVIIMYIFFQTLITGVLAGWWGWKNFKEHENLNEAGKGS